MDDGLTVITFLQARGLPPFDETICEDCGETAICLLFTSTQDPSMAPLAEIAKLFARRHAFTVMLQLHSALPAGGMGGASHANPPTFVGNVTGAGVAHG